MNLAKNRHLRFKQIIDNKYAVKTSNGVLNLVYIKTDHTINNYKINVVPFAVDAEGIIYEYFCTYHELLAALN